MKAISGEVIYCQMDAEKNLILPKKDTKNFVFKMKLNVHNHTILNVGSGRCVNYLFTDVDAELTASTYISTLVDFIRYENSLHPNVDVDLESDTCCAPNRNRYLGNALLRLAVELQITITQFFFIPGHSFMAIDHVHSLIERKIKNKEVTSVEEYESYIQNARKGQPLLTKRINHNFVLDYTQPLDVKSIRPVNGLVNDLKVIKYNKDGTMEGRLSYESEEWIKIPGKLKSENPNRKPLNDGPIALSQKKYNDIMSMMGVIPEPHREFFKNLPHS